MLHVFSTNRVKLVARTPTATIKDTHNADSIIESKVIYYLE